MLRPNPPQRENQRLRRSPAKNTDRRLPPTRAKLSDETGRVYLAAFRLRAFSRPITSSPGINFTRPKRTSSTRRLISSAQASSTPSSAGPSSRLSTSRSINRPRSFTESASALSSTSKPCADICAMPEFYTRLPTAPLREAPPPRRPVAFLSTGYIRPIPPIPAKPSFCAVRCLMDAQLPSLP
jgi:hypothetical protein